ncbi:unnamed protein product [Caenorhabditis brenneri]
MNLDIEYGNRHGKYIAGEGVSGNIIIKLEHEAPIEVTGLKTTMFMECKTVLSKDANGKIKLADFTDTLYQQFLNAQLFDGDKYKSKVFSAGCHSLPFMFIPLNKDFPSSCEKEHTYCRYYLEAELEMKSKDPVTVKKGFRVRSPPLDDSSVAHGWQTKSDAKYIKMTLKKVSMKVTLPKAIGQNENVPIHLSILNCSKYPRMIIRSKLVQTKIFKPDGSRDEIVKNSYVEEINAFNSEFTHFLKVDTGSSFNCRLFSKQHKIHIEVETAKSTLLRVLLPVTVGQWRNDPVREIIGSPNEIMKKETVESQQKLLNYLLNSIVELNTSSPSAPPASPITTAPTAPPMDDYGILPPLQNSQQHPLQNLPPVSSVKALYAFTGGDNSELSFNIGQVITNVHQSNEEGWMFGTISGNTGLFPFNFVEPIAINQFCSLN